MARFAAAFTLALAIMILAPEARAQDLSLGRDARVTVSSSIAAYELYNATSTQIVSGDAIALVLSLDPEAMAQDELAAVLLVGQRGTGIEPVTLRIAVSGAQRLSVTAGNEPGQFNVAVGESVYPLVLRDDASVELNNTVVGHVR